MLILPRGLNQHSWFFKKNQRALFVGSVTQPLVDSYFPIGRLISHRIHGAAIYGNMDPINIPPMLLAYIYIPYMDPMGMFICFPRKPWCLLMVLIAILHGTGARLYLDVFGWLSSQDVPQVRRCFGNVSAWWKAGPVCLEKPTNMVI